MSPIDHLIAHVTALFTGLIRHFVSSSGLTALGSLIWRIHILNPRRHASEVVYVIHRVEDVTDFLRLRQQDAQQQKLTEELRSRAGQIEAEIFLRTKEVQEINHRLETTNRELARSEERFRALFEFSPDAIIVTDNEGKISELNAQVQKFFGYERAELRGQRSRC